MKTSINSFEKSAKNAKNKKTNKILEKKRKNKSLAIAAIALIAGSFIGATVGISIESDRSMERLRDGAYQTAIIEGQKQWFETVVKSKASSPVNIANIEIPNYNIISRSNGVLKCGRFEFANYTAALKNAPNDKKCAKAADAYDNINYGELENVISEGSFLAHTDDNWDCGSANVVYQDKSLSECVVILRAGMNDEYSTFVQDNYLPEERKDQQLPNATFSVVDSSEEINSTESDSLVGGISTSGGWDGKNNTKNSSGVGSKSN